MHLQFNAISLVQFLNVALCLFYFVESRNGETESSPYTMPLNCLLKTDIVSCY